MNQHGEITRVTTVAANGPPPSEAAAIYVGEVMHARLAPFVHRFVYPVFSVLLDVDRLAEAGRMSRLFTVNRRGLLSFHESDQVERTGESLRRFLDRLLSEAGVDSPAERILLLCYPRLLGYVFNPISVYFAYAGDGRLVAAIYAVRNTFGQRHIYVARVEDGELTEAGLRQTRAKQFHVSPFIGMEARYHFRLLPPGRVVRLRIHETENAQPLLAATFTGEGVPLTTRSLAGLLVRIPFLTMKVMAAIHWEALRLWLKGARFHRSPPPPPVASYSDAETGGRAATLCAGE